MPLLQAAVKCDLIDAGFLFSTYDILKLFISEAEKKKKALVCFHLRVAEDIPSCIEKLCCL